MEQKAISFNLSQSLNQSINVQLNFDKKDVNLGSSQRSILDETFLLLNMIKDLKIILPQDIYIEKCEKIFENYKKLIEKTQITNKNE